MNSWKNISLTVGTGIFIIGGIILGLQVYQPPEKSDSIYKDALNSFKEEKYSESYYKFSKIVFSSPLKPIAIYRQALAADMIEDYKSAIKQYKFMLLLYPKHVMSIKARYNLAQDMMKNSPDEAKKNFEYIIAHFPNSDYAIASEYFIGAIDLKKYEKEKIFPQSAKNEIQNHFRHYLKKAPAGRLAPSVIQNWLDMGIDISKDDYLLIAKSYYSCGNYSKAAEILEKCEQKASWALDVVNSKENNNNPRVKAMTEWGLNGNSDYIEKEDVYAAIDAYMSTAPSKYQAANYLLGIAKGRGKDYVMSIKCAYSPDNQKTDCYKNLYLWYPTGDFLDVAQAQIFLGLVHANDNINAQKIGKDFLNKFKETSTYAAMVMYYMGRTSENTRSYRDYISYYKGVISKYPDSYYAYRSYLRLKHSNSPIIATFIHEKNIDFPYDRKHGFLDKLISLQDFDILDEYTSYDDFVKSWALYKKGDTSKAMLIARNAMDKLTEKPDKNDNRWKLVYPIMYYEEIKNASDKAGTIAPLMLALTREESYFNSNAESPVGARGLMQLMPTTALDIAGKHGISTVNLKNPEQNLLLGNYYYSALKSQLKGQDISTIAAYNGGIGSVNTWRQSINYYDTDSFIEQIPYPETKEYVKKVLRTYWNYVRIYDGTN